MAQNAFRRTGSSRRDSENSEPHHAETRHAKAHPYPCARVSSATLRQQSRGAHRATPVVIRRCRRSRPPKIRPADVCNSDYQRREPMLAVPTRAYELPREHR